MESNINDFEQLLFEQYKTSCEVCGTFPDYKVSQKFLSGKLYLNIDKFDPNLVEPLCHAIAQLISPVVIEIRRNKDWKVKSLQIPSYNIFHRIIKAVVTCLGKSKTFLFLKISNIKIPTISLSLLCKGLDNTKRLEHLSFENCCLKDSGVEKICLAIKNVASVKFLTFDNCSFGNCGIKAISNMIRHQSLNRNSLSWQDTLRGRNIELDAMKGLQSVHLNNNPLIGDDGAEIILSSLTDDIWIREVEMKNCGLSEAIMDSLKKLVCVNQRIEKFELGNNPFLGELNASEIKEMLAKRLPAKIKIKEPSKTESVVKNLDGNEVLLEIPSRVWPQEMGIPYRIEGRILERKENLPAGTLLNVIRELDKMKPLRKRKRASGMAFNLNNIRKMILYFKKRLRSEKKKRFEVEVKRNRLQRKLIRLEQKLKKSYVLDEPELAHIESTFFAFDQLLQRLKSIG